MKIHLIISTLFTLFSTKSFAATLTVIGPCSSTAAYSGEFVADDLKKSVGKLSMDIFEQQKVPYIGNESGFNSILNTPTGIDAIEVLSDTKMRAYGWCYSVNEIEPDVLAGDYFLNSKDDKIVWFFAYSTYDRGQWIDYCVPSYKVKAAQFCSKE